MRDAGRYTFTPNDFAFTLGQLAGKIEGLTTEVAASNKRDAEADKDLDGRVAKLERKGWIQQGVLIASGVAGSAVTQWIIYSGFIR